MSPTSPEASAPFRIGAVARLTGVSVHTLRKWEDRYGAVAPQRSEGGERLYTRDDLARLALIKRLADAGQSLRELATLTRSELEASWEQAHAAGATAASGGATATLRTAVLGSTLPSLLGRHRRVSRRLDVVAATGDAAELRSTLGDTAPDVLIVELPFVDTGRVAEVTALHHALGPGATLVVYGFASRADLASLQAAGLTTLRAPVDVTQMEQTAGLLLDAGPGVAANPPHADDETDATPAPRYSREVVARVAATVPRIHCECPHHVADIILSLRAFEDYSAACESRSPQDAELHRFLWHSAARARAIFEDAILRLAEAEGFSLEE